MINCLSKSPRVINLSVSAKEVFELIFILIKSDFSPPPPQQTNIHRPPFPSVIIEAQVKETCKKIRFKVTLFCLFIA